MIRFAAERSAATLAAAALFAGLGLATKTLAAFALVPLAVLVVLVARAAPSVACSPAACSSPQPCARPPLVRQGSARGRNPLFPNAYGVFGADPEIWTHRPTRHQQAFYDKFGFRDGFGSLIALPWDVTMHGAALAAASASPTSSCCRSPCCASRRGRSS